MIDKKELAKLALAGLLIAFHLPADAVKPPSPKQSTLIADAGGDYSIPRHRYSDGGSYGAPSSSGYNVAGSYGGIQDSSTNAGSYSSTLPTNRGSTVGGGYGAPENRPGSASNAGAWSGTERTNLGLSRVQEYNYSAYNTNRNTETNPTYQGNYPDSSYYSDTVAPYGASRTGFENGKGRNQGKSYGYEGIATSGVMTEAELLSQLTLQGRKLYLSLDPEGKALALQLASQANFSNKDLAVREADKRIQAMQQWKHQ